MRHPVHDGIDAVTPGLIVHAASPSSETSTMSLPVLCRFSTSKFLNTEAFVAEIRADEMASTPSPPSAAVPSPLTAMFTDVLPPKLNQKPQATPRPCPFFNGAL